MPITTNCQCGRKIKVADEHAGKRVKCPQCGEKVAIPAAGDSLASLLDDLPTAPYTAPAVASAACPGCGKPVVPGAVLCVNCGFNLQTGKRVGRKAPVPDEPAATKQPASKLKRRKKSAATLNRLKTRLAAALVIGLMVVVTLGGAWWIISTVSLARERSRLEELADKAKSAGEQGAVAQQLSRELPNVVAFCHYLVEQTKQAPTQRLQRDSQARLLTLSQALRQLPDGTDLAPLLAMPRSTLPFVESMRLVVDRSDVKWLLEKSCHATSDIRLFAADALGPSLPLGRTDDTRRDQLAAATSLAEKTQRYEQIYDEIHREIERSLAGKYLIQVDVAWKEASESHDAQPPIQTLITGSPRIAVGCKGREWTVDFFGKSWKGKVDELPNLVMECPLSQTGDDFSKVPKFEQLADARITFKADPAGFKLDVSPLQMYQPPTGGSVSFGEGDDISDVTSGFPSGAKISYEKFFDNGALVSQSVSWSLPATSGFSIFKTVAVKEGAAPVVAK